MLTGSWNNYGIIDATRGPWTFPAHYLVVFLQLKLTPGLLHTYGRVVVRLILKELRTRCVRGKVPELM